MTSCSPCRILSYLEILYIHIYVYDTEQILYIRIYIYDTEQSYWICLKCLNASVYNTLFDNLRIGHCTLVHCLGRANVRLQPTNISSNVVNMWCRGGTIDVPRCTITSHLPLYSVQWYTAKDKFGKIAKKSYFFWSHPPYDILLLHIIVCSANIRYNSLFHCLCTVTNTPLYNALLQCKSKSVTPTLSDSVWIVVFVLPLSTINMHHSPRLCS